MDIAPLRIEGAWLFTPRPHHDERGVFLESFTRSEFEQAVGHPLDLGQANLSVSAAGALRGIHFAQLPPGQAKYVTCLSGAVFDVVVDGRIGSPTYGQWEGVRLDDVDHRALYLSEGLGHGFLALEEGTAVSYLCSTPYDPSREFGVNPLDPALGIEWPLTFPDGRPVQPLLSAKDAAASTLDQVAERGLLAPYPEVLSYREGLRS